jgi:hypothetical protein
VVPQDTGASAVTRTVAACREDGAREEAGGCPVEEADDAEDVEDVEEVEELMRKVSAAPCHERKACLSWQA